MSTLPISPRITIAEYLRQEEKSVERHEYRDGEILAMAGGSLYHSAIVANVSAELHHRLKGTPCRPYDPNLRIRVPRTPFLTYPDVVVICGKVQPDPDDESGQSFTNPRVIVEVLSPTTEAYDRGEKFRRYRMIDSLEEYVLVSQSAPSVDVYRRQSDGKWALDSAWGLEATVVLSSVGVKLPMSDIYAGVSWPAGNGGAD